jgi:hypothetical protein
MQIQCIINQGILIFCVVNSYLDFFLIFFTNSSTNMINFMNLVRGMPIFFFFLYIFYAAIVYVFFMNKLISFRNENQFVV